MASAIVDGSFAQYGYQDAAIMTYFANFTLKSQWIIGDSNTDYGSTIIYPYILIDSYTE